MTKKTKAKIDFGKRLRQLRKEVGLSQEKLAFKSGLHRTYVGAIERGEQSVSVDNVQKLAKALGKKAKDLFDS
jgi:transcriptional regulator with XRE-family HTH domain